MSLVFNPSDSPNELISFAVDWLKLGRRVAMVTLVNIEGNAPYPIGSQMVINDLGEYQGQITGGCAELAIADQAVAAINKNQNTTVRYGLNSPFFDIQLPCGSGIDVYFDVMLSIEQGQEIVACLERRQVYQQVLETALGDYQKIYLPRPRLILFGQGPILCKLAELALKSGFDAACVAQNEQSERSLNDADLRVHSLQAGQALFVSELDVFTAVVSLFHEHERETTILEQALRSEAFYIGALGSRRTHQARLQSLMELGFDYAELSRINGPVGLNIGANTPSHIAISILAQIIETINRMN